MLHAGFKAERDYINIILGTTLVIFSLITAFAVRKMKPELVLSPQEAALKNAIEEKRKTDPLIGAKLGANALIQQLSADMSAQNPKGVHLESLLVMLGSLGGFSCQMAIHEGVAKSKKGSSKPLMEVRGADGRKYYFGDLLNAILAEEKISFFAFAGGSVGAKGGKLPDMQELLGHVSSSLGTENFGIPRYPEGHSAADTPYNFVKALWVSLLPNLKFYCHSPREWPIAFGIAVQNVIEQGKEHIPPEIALQIAMEAAAPMSKIDYQEIVHPHASAP